jgi:hypothetical protein
MQASTLLFCDIEADKTRLLRRHPTPFLARAGSNAHATVRGEGRRRTCPSLLLEVSPQGFTGSSPATGGCSSSRPFAHSSHNLRTQGSAQVHRLSPPHLAMARRCGSDDEVRALCWTASRLDGIAPPLLDEVLRSRAAGLKPPYFERLNCGGMAPSLLEPVESRPSCSLPVIALLRPC